MHSCFFPEWKLSGCTYCFVYKRTSEKTSSIFFCNNCSRILPHLDALHRWKSIVEYVFNFVEMSTTKQLKINADSAKSLKSQRQVIFWYFFIFFSFTEQRTFHENGESFFLIIIHLYTHTVIHIFVRTKLQDIQVFTWHELLFNIFKHYDYTWCQIMTPRSKPVESSSALSLTQLSQAEFCSMPSAEVMQ